MAVITQTFTLNLVPDLTNTLVIHCSQADGGLKQFVTNILNGTSAYVIPSGTKVYVQGTRADGVLFSHACSYSGSNVTVSLETDMTGAAGPAVSEILFLDSSNNRLGSANFILYVEEGFASGYDFDEYGEVTEAFAEYINAAVYYQGLSKSYAVGNTGIRDGENTDNAKYYAEKAEEAGNNVAGLDSVIDFSIVLPDRSVNNYKLTSSGNAKYDTNYKIDEYAVVPGNTICIKSAKPYNSGFASYQFQSSQSFSESHHNYLIGDPVLVAENREVIVPDGASWIIFSSLKTETFVGIYEAKRIGILEEKVDQYKKTADTIEKTIFSDLDVSAVSNGYSLKGDGLCQGSGSRQLKKYAVTAGTKVYLNLSKDGDCVYQWQSAINVPENGTNPYLIGSPVNEAVDEFIEVPEGATFLIVSQLKTNATNTVKAVDWNRLLMQLNGIEGKSDEALQTVENIEDAIFDVAESAAVINGYSLKGNGLCQGSGARQLIKYIVYAGSKVYLNLSKDGDGVYQWQSTINVPTEGVNSNLIGLPVNEAVNEIVTVPEGAKYLIVSQLRTNVTNTVKAVEWKNFVTRENAITQTFNSSFHIGATNFTEKCTKFASLMYGDVLADVSAPSDCESFLFFTDPHLLQSNEWEMKCYELMAQIQKYYNSTPTTFCLCGGDWLGNSDLPATACYKLGYIDGFMKALFDKYYMLVGNHDTNYQGKLTEDSERYSTRLSNQSIVDLWFRKAKKAYYKFTGSNTTFYCFDTGTERQSLTSYNNYGWEQAMWFADSLRTDNSSHIAITGHILYDSLPTDSDLCPLIAEVFKIAEAYNIRTTIDVNGTLYDYSQSTGKIEFSFFGHSHADFNGLINGIPYFLTINAGKLSDTASFDLLFVDYDNEKINLVRVGSGDDRVISMTTGELVTVS